MQSTLSRVYGIDEARSPAAAGWKLKVVPCRNRAPPAQPLAQQLSFNFFLASHPAGLCFLNHAPSYAATVSRGKPCTGAFWSFLCDFVLLSGQSQVVFQSQNSGESAAPCQRRAGPGRAGPKMAAGGGLRPRCPPGPSRGRAAAARGRPGLRRGADKNRENKSTREMGHERRGRTALIFLAAASGKLRCPHVASQPLYSNAPKFQRARGAFFKWAT